MGATARFIWAPNRGQQRPVLGSAQLTASQGVTPMCWRASQMDAGTLYCV
jgi:hypothetical protein